MHIDEGDQRFMLDSIATRRTMMIVYRIKFLCFYYNSVILLFHLSV